MSFLFWFSMPKLEAENLDNVASALRSGSSLGRTPHQRCAKRLQQNGIFIRLLNSGAAPQVVIVVGQNDGHTGQPQRSTGQLCTGTLLLTTLGGGMRRLRRITEQEVIAEFLKSEFHHEEFHQYREKVEHLVLQADLTNAAENDQRRALLYRRRGHMWRELPADTEWWEVQIESSDLNLIRVFPRAQWRRIADGSFLLPDVVERIRTRRFTGLAQECITKVHAIKGSLRRRDDLGCALLIGVDESNALTILEGNHRLTAALLDCDNVPQTQLRVLCGFSPRMNECCWYETNASNLWHYAKNRLKNLFDDRYLECVEQLPEGGVSESASDRAQTGLNAEPFCEIGDTAEAESSTHGKAV